MPRVERLDRLEPGDCRVVHEHVDRTEPARTSSTRRRRPRPGRGRPRRQSRCRRWPRCSQSSRSGCPRSGSRPARPSERSPRPPRPPPAKRSRDRQPDAAAGTGDECDAPVEPTVVLTVRRFASGHVEQTCASRPADATKRMRVDVSFASRRITGYGQRVGSVRSSDGTPRKSLTAVVTACRPSTRNVTVAPSAHPGTDSGPDDREAESGEVAAGSHGRDAAHGVSDVGLDARPVGEPTAIVVEHLAREFCGRPHAVPFGAAVVKLGSNVVGRPSCRPRERGGTEVLRVVRVGPEQDLRTRPAAAIRRGSRRAPRRRTDRCRPAAPCPDTASPTRRSEPRRRENPRRTARRRAWRGRAPRRPRR